MKLSVVTVLRNGVRLGYPFVESILSMLPIADEYVISEGYSDDGTYEYLLRLQAMAPDRIKIVRERWPEGLPGGKAIGVMQTQAMKLCRGKWIYLLQADEVMPPDNLRYIKELCDPWSTIRRVAGRRPEPADGTESDPPAQSAAPTEQSGKRKKIDGNMRDLMMARAGDVLGAVFVNAYNVDFIQLVDRMTVQHTRFLYRWAIRLVRNRPFIYSGTDGWQLQGPGCFPIGTARLRRPILHIGYCFPVNQWRKEINHAALYPDYTHTQKAAAAAREKLEAWEARGGDSAASEQSTVGTENPMLLPDLIVPLIGRAEYTVREELFEQEINFLT